MEDERGGISHGKQRKGHLKKAVLDKFCSNWSWRFTFEESHCEIKAIRVSPRIRNPIDLVRDGRRAIPK
jgi:hypothetical protein